ncbi:MAG: hypothetical protein AAF490_26585 [Chloroflexota bacterium]
MASDAGRSSILGPSSLGSIVSPSTGLLMGEMARFRTSSSIQDGVRVIPP